MLRVLLIDDEKMALDILEILLNKIGNIQVVEKTSETNTVLEKIKQYQVDVVFLDIEMPNINGLDLAKKIKEFCKEIYIVFVTAYNQYAVEAFEVNSIDYILKPVIKERLIKTVERITDIKGENYSINKTKMIQVKCFGDFTVFDSNNGNIVKWRTSKVKELFAYLINQNGKIAKRDSLLDDLWNNSDFKRAKTNLHTCMSYLKKNLRELGYDKAVIFQNGGYRLDIDSISCDYYDLKKEIALEENINESNINRFKKIAQLNPNEYMEKSGFVWLEEERTKLRKEMTIILEKMIAYYRSIGNTKALKKYLKNIIMSNPYNEKYYRELMRLHMVDGNRIKAIRLYKKLSKELSEEFGFGPEHETKKIYKECCEMYE